MEPVEIAAGRFQLRPWNKHDLDVIGGALADPEIAHWSLVPPGGDPSAWLAVREERWARGEGPSFAVMDAVTGEVYGHIALEGLDPEPRVAEIGFWTLPAARGRGVARHGVGAVSRWAFGALDLHRLELRHAAGNEGACAVANSSGYALEGVLPDFARTPDGAVEAGHLHARVATDT